MKKWHCKHCGAAIPTFGYSPSNYEKLQYCSNLCAHRAKSNPVEPRVCAMCGKVFTPLSKNRGQKCCSTACGVKYRQIYGSYHSTFRPDLPELTWDDVFERVKKFHPELSKKIGTRRKNHKRRIEMTYEDFLKNKIAIAKLEGF